MPLPIRILIVGNGFGGTYALKNLHKFFCGDRRVRISLVGEKNYFLFTPLLHEVATGGINPENIIEPIRKVLGCCLDRFHLGKVEFISLSERTVEVEGEKIPYDYLILAPGAKTNFYDIPGAEKYSLSLKSLEDAIKIKNHCILKIEHASHILDREVRKKKLTFVVVGGGATGVELATELEELIRETFAYYYPPEVIEDISILLVQKHSELIPAFGAKMRQKSLEVLRCKGINVLLNVTVKEVTASSVSLSDGTNIHTETVLWVAGIKPNIPKFDMTVASTEKGKLIVNEYLQLKDHREVFAIGDVAAFAENNSKYLPALAQVAVKEAKHVAKNIQLIVNGENPKPFLYHHTGSLVSLGRWMAVGDMFNITFWGRATWWLWRTVYLFKLISWKKKFKVALDWTINIFSSRDISQI